MARITVEDCIDKFSSRFELVLVASNRARKLHSGEEPTVDKDNDKNSVIALREIAEGTISAEDFKTSLIEEYQTVTLNDEEEDLVIENSKNIKEKDLYNENSNNQIPEEEDSLIEKSDNFENTESDIKNTQSLDSADEIHQEQNSSVDKESEQDNIRDIDAIKDHEENENKNLE